MEFTKYDYDNVINEINLMGLISRSDDDHDIVLENTINAFMKTADRFENIYKKNLYSNCNHILAHIEDHTYCIKCGLDDIVLRNGVTNDDEKLMLEYLSNNKLKGIDTEIICDKEMAMALTYRIALDKPTINTRELAKDFIDTINDIRSDNKCFRR